MSQDRLQILKMLEAGDITTDQALMLLDALDASDGADTPAASAYQVAIDAEPERDPAKLPSMRHWWLIPVAVGGIVMAIGAPLVALGISGQAGLFWSIFCGWIPFLIGLAILTLGVWSRSARWLHLRIKDAHSGRRSLALSFPLPLTLAAWIVRLIRPFVPQLKDTPVDELILALRDGVRDGDDQPIYIDVTDDDDGERVMLYIG